MSLESAELLNIGLFMSSNLILLSANINPTSILLTNLTYLSYIGYIKLKPISSFNTWFGAVVGSLPLLIGLTAN